jgi:hypothetical protein
MLSSESSVNAPMSSGKGLFAIFNGGYFIELDSTSHSFSFFYQYTIGGIYIYHTLS